MITEPPNTLQKKMSNSTSLPSQPPEPIKGISIFWPLFTLALASALHPLGSTCGEKLAHYRYYMRALPLSALLDSLLFFNRCGKDGHTACILARLDENNPKLIQPYFSNDEADCENVNLFLDFVVDFKVRLLPDVLVILAYVKLCTFSGVPGATALGSVYLLSWFFLEGLLMAQQFRRREMKMEKLSRAVTVSRQHENSVFSLDRNRGWNRLLLLFQVLAFLCIGIIVLVRHVRHKGHHSSARPPLHFTTVVTWFFVPSNRILEWAVPLMAAVIGRLESWSFFLAALYLLFINFPVMLVLGSLVMYSFLLNLAVVVVVLTCPLWVSYKVHRNFSSLWRTLERTLRSASILSCVKIFSFVFLVSSILYYAALYDSKGVSKRAWSDVLG